MVLQVLLGLFAFGENEDAGGVPVQPMDDICPIPGLAVPFADIFIQDKVDSPQLLPFGAND
jgi:hypothetical protein